MEFDRVWNELVDWLSVLLMLEVEDGVAEILEKLGRWYLLRACVIDNILCRGIGGESWRTSVDY